MSDVPPKLAALLVEAVVEALGHVDPARKFGRIEEPDDGDLTRLPLTAAIEFTGDRVKGALTFATTAEFLRLTTPVKTLPKGKEDVYQRDWLGETVNLILGNLKRKLVTKQLSFKVGTPYFGHYFHTTEMALERFGDGAYGDGYVQDFWFELSGQRAVFQLGLETDESFA